MNLRQIPFFARLPDGAIRILQSGLRMERRQRGEFLARPRHPVGALFIVCSGRLRVSHPQDEELGPGGWFGADAVLLGPPDGGAVVVVEDAELASIPRSCIDDLLRRSMCEALGLVEPEAIQHERAPANESGDPARPALLSTLSMTGHSTRPRVGLALSGGGAKAFAHLGVLKVLCGAGLPLDVLAGTSAGAIAAAMFCAGKAIPEMLAFADQFRRMILRREGMWDFLQPPTVGLIRGELTRTVYDQALDGRHFEHLVRPLAIPAADLLTGEAVVLRTGSVAGAVRASAGIPGLYAPWPHAGRFLVEGGLVNPLPVDLLREQGADLVIASQVIGSAAEMRVEPLEAPSPNLLALVAARANAILDRHAGKVVAEPDILIRPEVGDYDVLDYPMAEELIALGEAAAEAQLPHIRTSLRSNVQGIGR